MHRRRIGLRLLLLALCAPWLALTAGAQGLQISTPGPGLQPVQELQSAPLRIADARSLPSLSARALSAADLQIRPVQLPQAALEARRAGVVPGSFVDVVSELQPGVRIASDETLRKLASSMTGSLVDSARFGEPAQGILVSASQGIAVKLEPEKSGKAVATRPAFTEVVRDFHIPDQKVPLNLANLSYLAEGVTATSKKVPSNLAMTPVGRNVPPSTRSQGAGTADALVFTIDEQVRMGFDSEGQGVEIRFGGSIELIAPSIYGRYSKFSGYRLVFEAGERVHLETDAFIALDKEIRVPIQAFEIPAGFGSARLGLYLVADVKGNMRLDVTVDQGFHLEAGVRGGTFFYVPTGVRKVFDFDRWFSLDSDFNGKMEGFIGLSAEAGLRAFGFSLLDLVARAGLEANVEIEGNDMDIEAGFRMRIKGDVAGMRFRILDEYLSFISERRQQTGPYTIKILETCSYRSLIRGSIVEPIGVDSTKPYRGQLSLRIKDETGQVLRTMRTTTDAEGDFELTKAQLRQGDIVEVLVPGTTDNWACATKATFPFSRILLDWADYLDDEIAGSIDRRLSNQAMTVMPSAAPISYSGQATVYIADIDEVDGSDLYKATTGLKKIPVQIAGGEYTEPLPAGSLTPDSIVGIEIVWNGFIMQSNVERASGLVVAQIRNDGLELALSPATGSAASAQTGSRQGTGSGVARTGAMESWSADKSYTIISPVRSDKIPGGQATLSAGVDLFHRAAGDTEHHVPDLELSLEENLKHPLWFYRQQVDLKRWTPPAAIVPSFGGSKYVEASRAAVAQTGAWTATAAANPAVREGDFQGDRHFFEKLSYVYRGVELGYWSVQEFCAGFDSCDVAGFFGGNPYSRDTKIGNMMRSVNLPSLDGLGSLLNGQIGQGGFTDPGTMRSQAARTRILK